MLIIHDTKRIFTKVSKSTWLITELANQRARKALFTCVVYMHTPRPRLNCLSKLATSKKTFGIKNLKLFFYELFQWYSHANKIQLHKKGFALSLVLKVRVFVTQKWPVAGKEEKVGRQRTKNTAAKRLSMLRVELFRSSLRSHFRGKVSLARLHSLCSPRFVVLLHVARVFDHFVVLKLLLWITRQRSLEYLVH